MRTNQVPQLLSTLKDIDEKSMDFITPRERIEMKTNTDFGESPIRLSFGDYQMPLNKWAHMQLARKVDIPDRYYERMKSEKPELLAHNVNTWLQHKYPDSRIGKFLLRTTDGKLRAILSDRYKPIANESVLLTTINTLNELGEPYHVKQCSLSETTMYVKISGTQVYLMDPTHRDGDPMFAGICVRNSEVGASRFQVDIYTWRQVCGNGAILKQGVSKVHLGRKIFGEGEINFSERTEELDIATTISAMQDIIRQVFNPDEMQRIIEKIKAGKDIKILEPVVAVDNVAARYHFSEKQRDEILGRFYEKTQYGLGNAVTEYARDIRDEDEQIRVEEIGGEILTLGPDDFKKAYIRSEQ